MIINGVSGFIEKNWNLSLPRHFQWVSAISKAIFGKYCGQTNYPPERPSYSYLTLNQNLSTEVTKQRELVKYVAIENTFQNFQMGPMQHLDRETCIRHISGRPGFNGFWNVCSSWELWPRPLGHLIIFSFQSIFKWGEKSLSGPPTEPVFQQQLE